jgi:hypothetical protein
VRPRSCLGRTVLSAVVTCASVNVVFAQTPAADKPFRGLFGGSDVAIDSGKNGQFLDLTLATYAAFDQNEQPESARLHDEAQSFYRTGWLSGVNAQLLYVRRQDRVAFFAGGGTNQRYDRAQNQWERLTDRGSVGIDAALSPRTRLRIAQVVTRSPYYQLGITGELLLVNNEFDQLDAENADYTLLPRPAWTYATDASLAYDFSERASLEARYDHHYMSFSSEDLELRTQHESVMARYKTTPRSTFHVGYGYREGRYALAEQHRPTIVHDLDLGADYVRPLPFARRAAVAFSIGSAVVSTPGADSRFTLIGDANLSFGVGESWTAMAGYYRGVDFVSGLVDPLFVNGISGRLMGFVNERTDVSLFGEYEFGTFGFHAASSRYSNYTGSTRVRFALTRNVAIYAAHLYYHYGFGAGAELPSGLAQRLNRQGARAGLIVWLPVVRQ